MPLNPRVRAAGQSAHHSRPTLGLFQDYEDPLSCHLDSSVYLSLESDAVIFAGQPQSTIRTCSDYLGRSLASTASSSLTDTIQEPGRPDGAVEVVALRPAEESAGSGAARPHGRGPKA